jgi:hypothetical protein
MEYINNYLNTNEFRDRSSCLHLDTNNICYQLSDTIKYLESYNYLQERFYILESDTSKEPRLFRDSSCNIRNNAISKENYKTIVNPLSINWSNNNLCPLKVSLMPISSDTLFVELTGKYEEGDSESGFIEKRYFIFLFSFSQDNKLSIVESTCIPESTIKTSSRHY